MLPDRAEKADISLRCNKTATNDPFETLLCRSQPALIKLHKTNVGGDRGRRNSDSSPMNIFSATLGVPGLGVTDYVVKVGSRTDAIISETTWLYISAGVGAVTNAPPPDRS